MIQEQELSSPSTVQTGVSWFNAGLAWAMSHPYITSFVIGVLLAIVLSEILKAIFRSSFPEVIAEKKKRRLVHLVIVAVCHWFVVGRIYGSVAQGPHVFDVTLFSPVVGVALVWIVTRYIEYKTINTGPKSIWARIFIRLKPHRIVKGTNGELERALSKVDLTATTQFNLKPDETLILKDRKKKQ